MCLQVIFGPKCCEGENITRVFQQKSKCNDVGAASTRPVFVVIAKWSTDLDEIFMIYDISCSVMIKDEQIRSFLQRKKNKEVNCSVVYQTLLF